MQPGQLFSANLRLVRQLGQGGMGSVWVADHLGLGAQVAVKVMARAIAGQPELVERFRREASAAAQLKSPHVAQVFDHGVSASGEPFIVMELLEGEDLGKRIAREGPLPTALVADILGQVAKALSRAHAAGIVHRDIKPENVFLSEHDGELSVKVLDFGIAKTTQDASASVTSTQGTFGTPLYMGPEQLLSAKHVDFRADLWSFAVLAYFMLTARYPFEGETLGAISVAVNEGKSRPPSQRRAGISGEVDAWFARAFQRDPQARFGSAKEMAEALRAAVGTSPAAIAESVDPLGIGHLPTTMDTGQSGRSTPASDLPGSGAPTLGGASVSPAAEPKKRTLLLAAIGITVGVIAAIVVLRSAQPEVPATASLAPSKGAVVAAPPSVTATISVTVAPSTEEPRAADPARSPSIVSASPSTEPTGRASAATSATGSAPITAAKPATTARPVPTKKDDIGF